MISKLLKIRVVEANSSVEKPNINSNNMDGLASKDFKLMAYIF